MLYLCEALKQLTSIDTLAENSQTPYLLTVFLPPSLVEELLLKLQELMSAVNTGKDSL